MDNLKSQHTITTEQVSSSTGFFNVAYPLQIRWKDVDFPTKAPSPTSSVSAVTSSAILPSSTATGSPPTIINGLSTSGKIAIGVSVPMVLLALILISFIIIRVRRNNGKPKPTQDVATVVELPGEHSEKGQSTGTNVVSKGKRLAELTDQAIAVTPPGADAELPVPSSGIKRATIPEISTPITAERSELGGVNASELGGNNVFGTEGRAGAGAVTNRLECHEMP